MVLVLMVWDMTLEKGPMAEEMAMTWIGHHTMGWAPEKDLNLDEEIPTVLVIEIPMEKIIEKAQTMIEIPMEEIIGKAPIMMT